MFQKLTKFSRRFFDFYLNSSTHVALAVTAFTGITMFNLQLMLDINLLLFIFFSTVVGYNITKYSSSKYEPPETSRKPDHGILIFSLVCLLPLIWFMFMLPVPVIILSAILGLITISYSWPVLWRRSNLRDISGLKIFVISFVWSTATVVLPVLSREILSDKIIFLEYLQRFLFVIALTLPFDIRDIRFDTWQLGTIPQMIGVKRTKVLGIVLLSLVVSLEFLKKPLLADQALILIAISIFTAFLVIKSVVKQTQYYASFWVESIPIIWWGLLLVS